LRPPDDHQTCGVPGEFTDPISPISPCTSCVHYERPPPLFPQILLLYRQRSKPGGTLHNSGHAVITNIDSLAFPIAAFSTAPFRYFVITELVLAHAKLNLGDRPLRNDEPLLSTDPRSVRAARHHALTAESDCSVARRLGLFFCSWQRPSSDKHQFRIAMSCCRRRRGFGRPVFAGLIDNREAVAVHGNGRAHGPLEVMHGFVPLNPLPSNYLASRRPAILLWISAEHGTGTLVAAETGFSGIRRSLARRLVEIRAPCWLTAPPRYWRRLILRRMMLPEHQSSANLPIHASQDATGGPDQTNPELGWQPLWRHIVSKTKHPVPPFFPTNPETSRAGSSTGDAERAAITGHHST
jgi:hypothetical protein